MIKYHTKLNQFQTKNYSKKEFQLSFRGWDKILSLENRVEFIQVATHILCIWVLKTVQRNENAFFLGITFASNCFTISIPQLCPIDAFKLNPRRNFPREMQVRLTNTRISRRNRKETFAKIDRLPCRWVSGLAFYDRSFSDILGFGCWTRRSTCNRALVGNDPSKLDIRGFSWMPALSINTWSRWYFTEKYGCSVSLTPVDQPLPSRQFGFTAKKFWIISVLSDNGGETGPREDLLLYSARAQGRRKFSISR